MSSNYCKFDKLLDYFVDFICLNIAITVLVSFLEFYTTRLITIRSLLISLSLTTLIIYIRIHFIKLKTLDSDVCCKGNSIIYLILILNILIMLVTYIEYPVFPGNPSGDFYYYAYMSKKFIEGHARLSDLKCMHPGAYMLLSCISTLSTYILNAYLITRIYILTLCIFSVILTYRTLCRFNISSGSISVALVMNLILNLFWYHVVISTGLYANFIGIVLSLYIIILTRRFETANDLLSNIYVGLLAFLISAAMLSIHETTLLFLASLMIYSIVDMVINKRVKTSIFLLITLLPIILMVVLAPGDIELILNFLNEYVFKFKAFKGMRVIIIRRSDVTSNYIFKYSPFLGYLFLISPMTLVIIPLIFYYFTTNLVAVKNIRLIDLAILWFITIWIFTLFYHEVWRFSLMSLYPLVLASAYLYKLNTRIEDILNRITRYSKLRRALKIELVAIVIVILILSSNSTYILLDMSNIRSKVRMQLDILNAMEWIGANCKDAAIISIARWEFMYICFFTTSRDIHYVGDFCYKPSELISNLNRLKIPERYSTIYIVVWNKANENNIYYVDLYNGNKLFRRVYSNDEVTIFKLNYLTISK